MDTTQHNKEPETFEAWGLLELFGHQRLAGRLSSQTLGGCHFIRVDVPEVDGAQGYTRFFGNGAIYGMTITSEEVARALAGSLRALPVQAYEIPMLQPAREEQSDDDESIF